MKALLITFTMISIIFSGVSLNAQDNLDAGVEYKLQNVDRKLKEAEKYYAEGPSKSWYYKRYYKEAMKAYRQIPKEYGTSKFDENNPQISNIKKRLMELKAGIEEGFSPKLKTETKSTESFNTKQVDTKKLPSGLSDALASITKYINTAETETGWKVKKNYEYAQLKWAKTAERFGSQFDENNPQIASLKQRLDELSTKLKKPEAKVVVVKPSSTLTKTSTTIKGSLPSSVQNALEKVNKYLNEAENEKTGWKAKKSLKYAEDNFAKIKKRYAGEFDENSPEIVAVDERLSTLNIKLNPPQAGVPAPVKIAGEEKFPAQFEYYIISWQVNDPSPEASKKRVDYYIQTSGYDGFKITLKEFEDFRNGVPGIKDRNNPGLPDKFKNHSVLIAIQNRLDFEDKYFQETMAKGGETAKNFKPMLESVFAFETKLPKADGAVNIFFYDKSPDPETVRSSVSNMNQLVNSAQRSVKIFKEKFPVLNSDDNIKLMKEFTKFMSPTDANRMCRKIPTAFREINSYTKSWPEDVSKIATERFGYVQSGINDVNSALKNLEKYKDSTTGRKNAGQGLEEKITYTQLQLDVLDAFFPKDSNGKYGYDLNVKSKQIIADSDKIASQLMDVRKKTEAIIKSGISAEKARLAKARMPKAKFSGGKWDKVNQDIVTAYEESWPEKVKKVSIMTDWKNTSEWERRGNTSAFLTFKYIWAYVAVQKKGSDIYRVYYLSYRKIHQPDGGYGPIESWGVGSSFEMLPENLDK